MTEHESCDEYIDVGPFRFECDGHIPGVRRRAIEYHGGKVQHTATSPQDVGDVDVIFWTWVEPESTWERRKLDPAHPALSTEDPEPEFSGVLPRQEPRNVRHYIAHPVSTEDTDDK